MDEEQFQFINGAEDVTMDLQMRNPNKKFHHSSAKCMGK